MTNLPPRYWRTLEERQGNAPESKPVLDPGGTGQDEAQKHPSRRDFLKLVGASTAVAATVACGKSGKSQVVPYLKQPVEIVPGRANYYATTCPEGDRSYAVLVKTREGRPIHIAGNDEHPELSGKTSLRAMADVLSLYDPDRLRGPKILGRSVSWAEAEMRLAALASQALQEKKPLLLLSGASVSPTRQSLLKDLVQALPNLEHLVWEPSGGEGRQEASLALFGGPCQFRPDLEKAQVIVSLGADFLNGDDPQAIAAFSSKRCVNAPGQPMNRLWVFEGPLSVTGSNADERFPVRPSRLAALGWALARDLQLPLPEGVQWPLDLPPVPIPGDAWQRLIQDLRAAGPKSVVVCGDSLPAEVHGAAHLLNVLLKSGCLRGRAVEPRATLRDLEAVRRSMVGGKYAAVVLWGVNPGHAFPDPEAWKQAFLQVPNRVWIGQVEDESAQICNVVLPEHHWLEAWGDHLDGACLTLQQPTVGSLYDTRQGEDVLLSLLRGLGQTVPDTYHAYLKQRWRREVHQGPLSFERYWEGALHDGLIKLESWIPQPAFRGAGLSALTQRAVRLTDGPGDDLELLLQSGLLLDGRHGHNSWLQELPDPVTKCTWGNPLSVAVQDARRLNLHDGDEAELTVKGRKWTLPVIVQPGQAPGTLSLALGYGRQTGGVAKGVGINGFPMMSLEASCPNLIFGVTLSRAKPRLFGGRAELPRTQSHHHLKGRDLVHSIDLQTLNTWHKPHVPELASLNPEQAFHDHHWGMVIDLAACVGCGACVLACQSENNVATVGPAQVAKGREMHWIRIDRYYEGDEANPRVVHQPMFCQQCDHAPCENVCPVNATNHGPDGLNQMAYNRCVGTRYCANNCPYKVRRFNFLEYMAQKSELESLVFNPEVTVRPRGVMEKCTFCVQRIQDAQIRAKVEHRPLKDGEIEPACAAACPGHAIVFGDLKDPASRVSQLVRSRRAFKVLEELGARPVITYLADLKNPAVPSSPAKEVSHAR